MTLWRDKRGSETFFDFEGIGLNFVSTDSPEVLAITFGSPHRCAVLKILGIMGEPPNISARQCDEILKLSVYDDDTNIGTI